MKKLLAVLSIVFITSVSFAGNSKTDAQFQEKMGQNDPSCVKCEAIFGQKGKLTTEVRSTDSVKDKVEATEVLSK